MFAITLHGYQDQPMQFRVNPESPEGCIWFQSRMLKPDGKAFDDLWWDMPASAVVELERLYPDTVRCLREVHKLQLPDDTIVFESVEMGTIVARSEIDSGPCVAGWAISMAVMLVIAVVLLAVAAYWG